MSDSDLTFQILVTLALVLAINLAFTLIVASILESLVAPPLIDVLGVSFNGAFFLLVVALVLVGLLLVQVRYTRSELLGEAGAREVSAESHPDLHARVTRLAAQADVSLPRLAVVDSSVPNSFAVGDFRGGTLVVSEGLLAVLSPDELDAVLAHELAHLANRDALVMTLASFLPALAAGEYDVIEEELPAWVKPVGLLAIVACWFLLSSVFLDPLQSVLILLAFIVVALAVLFMLGNALGLLAFPAIVLSRGLSRQREFAADRAGAYLVGDPAAMVSALTTLGGYAVPETDARATSAGLDGMCFMPYGFAGPADAEIAGLSSHPPTADRIERLREVAADLEAV